MGTRTEFQRIRNMSPLHHLCPAFSREGPELLLNNRERENGQARFFDPTPVGIGVEAVISDCDLAFIRDMGSDPGDELQVVHPLHLRVLFPILVADLACLFIEGEAFQGKERPDHVLSHALGFFLCLGPDAAVNITVGTADAGKPTARVPSIQVTLDDLLDNRPKEAVFFLETALILHQEALEVMEEHTVEDGALGMSGTIDSWHRRR